MISQQHFQLSFAVFLFTLLSLGCKPIFAKQQLSDLQINSKKSTGMVKIQFTGSDQPNSSAAIPAKSQAASLAALPTFEATLNAERKPPEPEDELNELPPPKKSAPDIPSGNNNQKPIPTDDPQSKLKELNQLKFATNEVKPLRDISLKISMKSNQSKLDKPTDIASVEFAKHGEFQSISSYPTSRLGGSYSLATSAFCHRPLYFEQPNLERHGHHFGAFTPLVSAIHFYGTIPILPYKMAIATQRDCVYHGNIYRPGSPAMHETAWPPLRLGPSVVEATAITGLIFLIP